MTETEKRPSTIAIGPEARARVDGYCDHLESMTGIRPPIASVVRRALSIGLESMLAGEGVTSEEKYHRG